MAVWRAIVLLFTLKCDHATHLMSDSFERDLSPVERWALELHKLICRHCRRFARQIRLIQGAARRHGSGDGQLSEPARGRITAALAAQADRGGG